MEFTENDQELCEELRHRISDLGITDSYRLMDCNLIRFIRARDMNLDKAEAMYRAYIDWRKEHDIDNAATWEVAQDLKENFRYKIVGLNRSGGLVITADVGQWDPALSHSRYNEVMQVAYHELEILTSYAKYFVLNTPKKTFSKMIVIINLEGLTWAHCTSVDWIRAMITLLKAFEEYLPETLAKAFLINAPWVFSILWSVAKPFISTSTHQRIKFLGGDKEIWKNEILELVEEDQFPERFGGSLPDDYELVFEGEHVVGKRIPDSNENDPSVATNNAAETDHKPEDSIELD